MDGVLQYLYNNLFQCKSCDARFSSKPHLVEHEKCHTENDGTLPATEEDPEGMQQVQVKTEIVDDNDEYMTNHGAAGRSESQSAGHNVFQMFCASQASGSGSQDGVNDGDTSTLDKFQRKMKAVKDNQSAFAKMMKIRAQQSKGAENDIDPNSDGSSFAMYLTWQKIAEQTASKDQSGAIAEYGKIVTRIEGENDEDDKGSIVTSSESKDQNSDEIPKETMETVDNYVKEVLTQMGLKNSVEEDPPKKDKPPLEKPFKCDQCGHCFAQNYKLIRHYRVHTGERPYKCKLCDAAFSQKSILDNHGRLHTGEKPFRCELCNAVFSVKGYLIKHYRTHTGEKPFKCNMCDSVFSDRGNLSKHKKIHSGEKPYKCGSCAAAFSDRSTLTKHQRIHTSDKAFKCEYCNASFAMKSALTTHKKLHTTDEQHKCDVCEAEFSQRGYLIRHLRTHTGEKQYIPSFLAAKKDEMSSIVTRSSLTGQPGMNDEMVGENSSFMTQDSTLDDQEESSISLDTDIGAKFEGKDEKT